MMMCRRHLKNYLFSQLWASFPQGGLSSYPISLDSQPFFAVWGLLA